MSERPNGLTRFILNAEILRERCRRAFLLGFSRGWLLANAVALPIVAAYLAWCAWRNAKACKGYCDLLGVTESDLQQAKEYL